MAGSRRFARPRGRHIPGVMNKTEEAYDGYLHGMMLSGQIQSHSFESVKLRLAKNTFYSPDFMVVCEDRIEFHEVKGFWEDDARVKIKVAASLYPWFLFVAVKLDPKKGVIEREEF